MRGSGLALAEGVSVPLPRMGRNHLGPTRPTSPDLVPVLSTRLPGLIALATAPRLALSLARTALTSLLP